MGVSLFLAVFLSAGLIPVRGAETGAPPQEPLKPIGEAKGIHPGRVVWVHDPEVLKWNGPGDGHWYEATHSRQDRADAMASADEYAPLVEDGREDILVPRCLVREPPQQIAGVRMDADGPF